jgi:hypothetical protein
MDRETDRIENARDMVAGSEDRAPKAIVKVKTIQRRGIMEINQDGRVAQLPQYGESAQTTVGQERRRPSGASRRREAAWLALGEWEEALPRGEAGRVKGRAVEQ